MEATTVLLPKEQPVLSRGTRSIKRQRRKTTPGNFDNDMLMKLYELLQGQRNKVIVFSKVLNEKLMFINPAFYPEAELDTENTVYTTRELAFVLSLNTEEFRRYHYLKRHLV